MDLSVLLLARNEEGNLNDLLPRIHTTLRARNFQYEIVVIDGMSTDRTAEVASSLGARVIAQIEAGYGAAFNEGIRACEGRYILALDADCSHPPEAVDELLGSIDKADLVIASRYVAGASSVMPPHRYYLSRLLSLICKTALRLPVRDASSGFRLYRAEPVKKIELRGRDFDVLIEVLVGLADRGCSIKEVPFTYKERLYGRSHVHYFRFARSYLKTLTRLALRRRK